MARWSGYNGDGRARARERKERRRAVLGCSCRRWGGEGLEAATGVSSTLRCTSGVRQCLPTGWPLAPGFKFDSKFKPSSNQFEF
jgi:hypothetical protein